MEKVFRVPTLSFLLLQTWFGVAWVHGTVISCTHDSGLTTVGDEFVFPVGISARAKVDSRRNASGRKCTELFTNTFRKSVKMRVLGFKNFGRKYVKIFAGTIVNSKKMTIFATH